jgi:subtilisin family serine protease
MFLMDSPNLPGQGGNILAVSDVPNSTSTEDPLQSLIYPTSKDEKVYIAIGRELNGSPAPEFLKWVSTANGLDRTIDYEYIDREKGQSTVYGAANAEDAIAVGAVDSQQDFSKTPELQNSTSRGGAPILFDTDGDPLLNPQQRSKPDIAGIDNVFTTLPGYETAFKGTSAAAPHIAGVVALMEQAAGGTDVLSPQQITEILQSTSTPL